MRRARDQWHPSHELTTAPKPKPRTRDTIAARNRAWRELLAVLPLPHRYINQQGDFNQ